MVGPTYPTQGRASALTGHYVPVPLTIMNVSTNINMWECRSASLMMVYNERNNTKSNDQQQHTTV